MSKTEVRPGVWVRFDAAEPEAPVLIDVSRSGREYPHDFRSPLPFTDLHDNVSTYVEELYAIGPSLWAPRVCMLSQHVHRHQPKCCRYRRNDDRRQMAGSDQTDDSTERGLGLLKRCRATVSRSRSASSQWRRSRTAGSPSGALSSGTRPHPRRHETERRRSVSTELPLHVCRRSADACRPWKATC